MIACLVCQWGHVGETNLAGADGTSASTQPRVKKATVASVVIRVDLPDSVGQPGLFGQMEVNLAKAISRLDKAAADKAAAAAAKTLADAQKVAKAARDKATAMHRTSEIDSDSVFFVVMSTASIVALRD